MKKKKDERMSHFKRKNKKLKNEKDETVTINIGIMRYVEEESIVKPQRGNSLPIRLPKTADSEEVLKLAVAKQSLHNGNEIVHSSVKSYKLLYPDGTEVKQLKESDEAFSLGSPRGMIVRVLGHRIATFYAEFKTGFNLATAMATKHFITEGSMSCHSHEEVAMLDAEIPGNESLSGSL